MKIFSHIKFGHYDTFSYWLSTKVTSFTYLFRKPYYKFRLLKKIASLEYYGPWEMTGYLQEVAFAVFCEFYLHGGIEYINWDSDDCHKHAKEEMDYLYRWWMKDRHERQEEIDTVLDTWYEHHISWWEDLENNYCRYCNVENKYAKYLSKLMDELEQKFEREKEENFIRLVKIRGYLWT